MEWFYTSEGNRKGPVSADVIISLLSAGQISGETLVWTASMSEWQPLRTTEMFKSQPHQNPPPLPASAFSGTAIITCLIASLISIFLFAVIERKFNFGLVLDVNAYFTLGFITLILTGIGNISNGLNKRKLKRAGFPFSQSFYYQIIPLAAIALAAYVNFISNPITSYSFPTFVAWVVLINLCDWFIFFVRRWLLTNKGGFYAAYIPLLLGILALIEANAVLS
jgi:hypothetical protein